MVNASYKFLKRLEPCSFKLSDKQREVQRVFISSSVTPSSGSIATVVILSGVSSATSSIFTPPSVETIKLTWDVFLSTKIDRYSSSAIFEPSSIYTLLTFFPSGPV